MDSVAGSFMRSIIVLNRQFKAEMVKQMEVEVTGPQMLLLHLIAERKRCKLTELAEQLEVKPSAVTVMVDRLVKCGYVIRIRDELDRRVILSELTDSGYQVLQKAKDIRLGIAEHLLDGLEPKERQTLAVLLEKLMSNQQKTGQ